jgi:hypothetical protein
VLGCATPPPRSQDMFRALHANHNIVEQSMEQLYSEALGKFLADRFVVGTCPKCRYEVCVQDCWGRREGWRDASGLPPCTGGWVWPALCRRGQRHVTQRLLSQGAAGRLLQVVLVQGRVCLGSAPWVFGGTWTAWYACRQHMPLPVDRHG